MTDKPKGFYVYLHRKLSDNSVFYVGKGTGRRAWVKKGRSKYWQRVKDKHGYTVEILFDNLTEEESFQVEIDTIKELQYFGYDLCNLTLGGGGVSGYNWTEEQRNNLSKSVSGKIRSEEHCKNLSLALKGKKPTQERIEKMRKSLTGKKQTLETIEKRKKSLAKIKHLADKSVYVWYSLEDIFIGTRLEFSEYTGIHNKKLRTLFQTNPHKTCKGWSILNLKSLIIFGELNANRN